MGVTDGADEAADALELVSQVVDYAIIRLDTDGTIRSGNAGAERLKGYRADEAVGRHFSMFYTAVDRDAGLPQQLLEQARDDGRVLHTGLQVRRDGSRFWGDVAITALHDDGGRLSGFAKVTRDRTEEHELAESLRASEARLRLLVMQVVDYAIINLDPDGTIRTWNAGAEALKGYRAQDAVGRHFSMFYTGDDRADGLPDRLLAQARADGRVEHTGWRVRQDGSLFWGDVVITALHDDVGGLTGYAKVTRDRTDQHRLEQLQASLFAALSHDIRHPLMSIGAYAALLPKADEAERTTYSERIVAEAEQLEALITTMFDYAKLRAGAVPISLEPLSLGDAVREYVATHEPMLGGREVDLDTDGAVASADRVALRRVLGNLVSNAVKYSPDGTPIRLATRDMGRWVEVSVTDRGRGVAPEDVPVIFTEFVRGQFATDDGGTGLGLSSVRKLVELQGGRVQMTSRVGEGTTVTVVLDSA